MIILQVYSSPICGYSAFLSQPAPQWGILRPGRNNRKKVSLEHSGTKKNAHERKKTLRKAKKRSGLDFFAQEAIQTVGKGSKKVWKGSRSFGDGFGDKRVCSNRRPFQDFAEESIYTYWNQPRRN